MAVTREDLRHALRELGLAKQAVCLHSSLSSFGQVTGGAAIRANPEITHCGVSEGERCNDAVKGGPIVPVNDK